ncbi:MAG: LapA family protein [Spirochaeta sp.]
MFFIGYNLENTADISVVFYTFEDVPIFFSMFGSFLIGVIIMLPFVFGKPLKKKLSSTKNKGEKSGKKNDQQQQKNTQQTGE